ncbi:MAG TPA: zf-HC2 domain-containing protein [Humisphaera sp.]|jgi:anti-sigma factor RsiW|nr:zf-HC2 domain-containing protein [Humisphaera sp.]
MNSCNFQPQLSAYYDGELSEQQRDALGEHVSTCESCSAELAAYNRLSEALAEQMRVSPSQDAMQSMRAGLKKSVQQRWWREAGSQVEYMVRRITAVAAVILAGASAALLWIPNRAGPTTRADEVIVDSVAVGSEPATAATVSTPGNEERQLARWIVADLSQQEVASAVLPANHQ